MCMTAMRWVVYPGDHHPSKADCLRVLIWGLVAVYAWACLAVEAMLTH